MCTLLNGRVEALVESILLVLDNRFGECAGR